MALKNCRHFNGYKPCGKSRYCENGCEHFDSYNSKVLVVGLGAMGAVLRATSVLPGIVRKYPGAHVTWLTELRALPLLENNPLVDRIAGLEFMSLLSLGGEQFDAVFVMDKDQRIGGILSHLQAKEVFGFKKDNSSLGILPANPEATELWKLGLDNDLKFHRNRKTETQLLFEAFALGEWSRDPYILRLSDYEKRESRRRRSQWLEDKNHLLGLNTGCSALYPNKKLSIEKQREVIVQLQKEVAGLSIVLLGGPEDRERNLKISDGLDVKLSPTEKGLRDGLVSTEACDLIFSGDSLGLHMAIALRKWSIVWFGPTCEQEIDLYDNGEKILSSASCMPCWKRVCHKDVMCYDLVSVYEVVDAVKRGIQSCTSSSSKLLFSET